MNNYLENVKYCYKHIPYTWKHKLAFINTEKQLTCKVRLSSYLHDCDKLISYALSPITCKTVKQIHTKHRDNSNHHVVCGTDYLSMVIDWECARITKPDKPLNARETMEKYYPEMSKFIEPVLRQYNL